MSHTAIQVNTFVSHDKYFRTANNAQTTLNCIAMMNVCTTDTTAALCNAFGQDFYKKLLTTFTFYAYIITI